MIVSLLMTPSTSIHILTWRMTSTSVILKLPILDFNPHPHMEDDDTFPVFRIGRKHFNPHPHMEDDSYIWYILLQNIAYIES